MKRHRYCIVVPPDGAARAVGFKASQSLLFHRDAAYVKVIDSGSYLRGFSKLLVNADVNMVTDLFNQSCAVACLDFMATHCIVCSLAPVTLFTLNLFRKHGIVTAHWFYEDVQKATYWKQVIEGYDHFFAIQHEEIAEKCSEKAVPFHFLPTATSAPDGLFASRQPALYDAVFIGIPSTYRISVLESLVKSGIRLAIAGAQWNHYIGILEPFIVTSQWMNDQDATILMQKSKIGINLAFDDASQRPDMHMSPRIFDYAAAGCSIVSDASPLIAMSFTGGIVHQGKSADEVRSLTIEHIARYQCSEADRKFNHDLVMRTHRYDHRIAKMLETID